MKYTNALKACAVEQSNGNRSGIRSMPRNGANPNDHSDDIEMSERTPITTINGVGTAVSNPSVPEDSTQNERKRKSPESAPDDPLKSPRKRRKTSDHNHTAIRAANSMKSINSMNSMNTNHFNNGLDGVDEIDGRYTPRQLCPDQDFLSDDQKMAIFKVFEHTALIESVWNFSRKALINAFLQRELDLPTISGLQTCTELAWSVLPRFVELPDDIAGDFDDILTLYKDFNKERVPRASRPQFSSSLLAHHAHAAAGGTASDDDQPNGVHNGHGPHGSHGGGHGISGIAFVSPNHHHHHRNGTFKWEDYDTLDEFDDSDENDADDSIFLQDLKLGLISKVRSGQRVNSLKRLANLAPIRQAAAAQEMPIQSLLKMQSASTPRSCGGSAAGAHSEDIKMQKGRFRIESETDHEQKEMVGDGDEAYLYEEPGGDERGLEYLEGNMYDGDGYIDGMNRKEFRLEMKKRRIIRRTKNKEYKDRVMQYQRAEFLYHQVQPHLFDESTKKKRSKHKLSAPQCIMIP